ncbi:tail fiber domain-containing protein [Emticicia sp. C21]|uniref:tail fiber domain-containing protein n=1 Tax=Emticicia sp. C21 TaxID=2302915 RepID=UPI000E34FFF3|nr:tail fiber domain-containing protein [Emticicia sp. C21]RFS17017.1 tail fiber domain-containing protein [Emticicia sp. C21]
MKKHLLILGLMAGSIQFTYAQSATVTPHTSDFFNHTSEEDAYALKGTVTNYVGGANAKGVWGHSIAFSTLSAGVYGSHVSGGIGVKGEAPYGSGVYGLTSTGIAVSANAIGGGVGLISTAAGNNAARFQITNPDNGYTAVEITTQGNGTGIETTVYGNGAGAFFRNVNPNGNGAGLVVQKTKPYIINYTQNPNADLEVRHPTGYFGMTGVRILNTDTNLNSWTLYTNNDDGALFLYAKGEKRGSFNATTGAYTATSDVRLKKNMSNYASILKNIMKMDVMTYQLLNSDKTEVGLMAQQTMKYFPEVVYDNRNERGEQYYSMDYSRIGVLAIKAVQEQQMIIQKQQKEINTLKEQVKEIDALKSEMEELKKLIKSARR